MPPGEWTGFFATQAGASATLTGLVFVALSINLKMILVLPGAPGRAGEALILLLTPVFLGLAGLIAHQREQALGIEWLIVGSASWFAVTGIILHDQPALGPHSLKLSLRILVAEAATLALVIGGALLTAGVSQGLGWQAAGTAACLLAGILDAWVLLVEILR